MTRTFSLFSAALGLVLMLAGGCAGIGDSDFGSTFESYNGAGVRAFGRGDLATAEQLFTKALGKTEFQFQSQFQFLEHEKRANVSTALENLGRVKRFLCKDDEAEQLLRRSIEVGEKAWGPESPFVSSGLIELAKLYYHQDRFSESVSLMQRGVPIAETEMDVAGLTPAGLSYAMDLYTDALRKTNRENEAQAVEARLNTLRARPDYSALREKAWRASEEECKNQKR